MTALLQRIPRSVLGTRDGEMGHGGYNIDFQHGYRDLTR
jgi:hypothetical protein